ncbi:hypothetical protein HELRODRAFT_169592 [Helobdella robusta]|uniref:Uncharacterized protein n=1 Tax=Helobdella robusta TaxID=6412 RepID=T1F253_HELRO|nr:hypothetical protein HELRODRAFT_169592 [Helobdella robusta]ESO07892.1 hypothetical protein HELRODRAFT_169592 [Helobdella robusta]
MSLSTTRGTHFDRITGLAEIELLTFWTSVPCPKESRRKWKSPNVAHLDGIPVGWDAPNHGKVWMHHISIGSDVLDFGKFVDVPAGLGSLLIYLNGPITANLTPWLTNRVAPSI